MAETLVGISGILFILLIILFIVWICIPFIIMATNLRLDKIIKILKSYQSSLPSGNPQNPIIEKDEADISGTRSTAKTWVWLLIFFAVIIALYILVNLSN